MDSQQSSENFMPYTPNEMDPGRPPVPEMLRALAEGQRLNQDTMNGLAQAMTALLNNTARPAPSGHSSGPKVREPRTYDGDRKDGKLDDFIRDITNWVSFYKRRNHWTTEREAVELL